MFRAIDALVPAIGWALLHFLWQGVLIGCLASLGLQLLRNARPQTRYLFACGALLLCALLPLAGIVLHLASPHAAALEAAGAMVASAAGGAAANSAADAAALTGFGAVQLLPAQSMLPLLKEAGLNGWLAYLPRLLPWLVLMWAAGAALMTLRLSLGLQWVKERTLPSHYRDDPHWQQVLDRLARRLGVRVPVRLGVSDDDLEGPMTAGCLRPLVLIPASLLTGMPPALLEALLAHELAHIRRHDYLVNLVQSAIEILLFYHPVVWMLSRRIRAEREQIADDIAASALGEPRRLALALSELDKFQFSTTHFAPAAQGGDLMSRIKRLIRPQAEPLGWKIAAPLLGLCTACAVLYAHAVPAPQPPAMPDKRSVAAAPDLPEMPEMPAAPDAPAAADAPAMPAWPARPAVPPAPPARAAAAPAAPAAPMASAVLPAAPAAPMTMAVAPAAPAAPMAMAAAPAAPAAPMVHAALPAAPAAPAAPMATPATPAAHAIVPAAPALPRSRTGSHYYFQQGGESYALVREGGNKVLITSRNGDPEELSRLKQSVKGDFIWFRKDGKSYLIQDPAIVAQASAAWAPLKQIESRMEEHNKAMEAQGNIMGQIGEKIGSHYAQISDSAAQRALERRTESRIKALASQQEAIGARMDALGRKIEREIDDQVRAGLVRDLSQLSTRMAPLQSQISALSAEMGKQHARLVREQPAIEDLNRQMREASKPMAELGRKMGELGREQGRIHREADKATRRLIEDAVQQGRAVQANGGSA